MVSGVGTRGDFTAASRDFLRQPLEAGSLALSPPEREMRFS